MTTIRNIADDVILHLGELQDDAEVTVARVAYWVKMWADKLLAQRLGKRMEGGVAGRDTGAYDTAFIVGTAMDPDMQYMYFTLPRNILDLNRDGGIKAITYVRDNVPENCPKDGEKLEFSWTTFDRLQTLAGSTYQSPSPFRPYFFRMNTRIPTEPGLSRVYLPGVASAITRVRVILVLSIPPLADVDVDAPFEFPDDLVGPLTMAVVNMGRMALQVPQERLLNDGRDNMLGAPPPASATGKVVSVNDTMMQSE